MAACSLWSPSTPSWTSYRSDSAAPTSSSTFIVGHRFISFSPDSSCSSCSASCSTVLRCVGNKNPVQDARTHDDGSFSIVHNYDRSVNFKKKENKKGEAGTFPEMGLKKIARKRPLWQRIWFVSKKIRSIVLLNVITVVYASDISVVKGAEEIMDPAAFSAVRFVVSAIPFLPFVFQARDDVETRNAGMELGLWVSLGYLIEALGLLTSDAGRASFFSLFTVIVVPLLDGMLGAIIPARTWFGVLMSVLGVAMLECSGSPPNVGDLLSFLSAIFFGIHMLRTEHISRSTKKENFLPLLGYEVCVVAMFSTIWVLIGGLLDGVWDIDQSSWSLTELRDWIVAFPWIPALYTGVFSTGLCLWIEIAAMRNVSATETAVIYGMEPLWGAGFAWFLLGERWGTTGWIGAALILGGSLMVQIFGSSAPNESTEADDTKEAEIALVPNKQKLQNGFSASPIVVRPRKDVMDILK